MTQRASVRRRGRRRRAKLTADLLRGTVTIREPNAAERRWIHRGLTCMVRAGPKELGFFNGYVAVPPEHPWYRRHYDKVDVAIHGGLTYAELEPDGWVFGFDTGHGGDVWPEQKQPSYMTTWKERIWTMYKLETEVQRLADQLAEAQD